MVRKCASVVFILGLNLPGMAMALGLGELTVQSYLNEPLVAKVDLLETGELDSEQVRIRLASREDFSRAGVERAYFLTSLKFDVQLTEDGSGVLHISSDKPVREPYLDFVVEARWPSGRLLREYTILLDPPVFSGPDSGITARASTANRPTSPVTSTPTTTESQPQYSQPAPERTYGAGALDEPQAGSEYLVKRSETLWSIASRSRPEGATVQQAMLDIKRLNPEAFIGGNINQLKAGYVLRLPTAAELSDIGYEEAVAVVAEQEQRWQDNAAGIDVGRVDASEGQDSSGVAGSDDEEGHLQIAGVEGSDYDSAAQGDLSAQLEDLDRTQRDNADLRAQLDAMAQQVQMQQRLIELKDDQIAALQQAVSGSAEIADPELTAQQEGIIESMADDESEFFETMGNPVEAVEESAEEVVQQPRPAPPKPEPGILDLVMENIIYVGAGVLLVLLALVFLLRGKSKGGRERKSDDEERRDGDEDEFAGVELLSDDSLIVDEFTEDAEGEAVGEQISNFSARDDDVYAAQFESGDALAEADIYIAYGRFPQAVDLLKTAIATELANTEYRVKLMEACVEMGESSEFQQQYADLQVIGDDAALQRAKALLGSVDGGEVWMDKLPEPSITPEQVAEAKAAHEAALAKALSAETRADDFSGVDLGLDDSDSAGGDLDTDFELDAEDAGLDLELDDDALSGLDAELDLDLDDLSGAVEEGVELDLANLEEDGIDAVEEAADEGALGGLELEPLEAESAEQEAATEAAPEEEQPVKVQFGGVESAPDAAVEGEMSLDELDLGSLDTAAETEAGDELGLPDLELDDLTTDGGDELSLELEPEIAEAPEADDFLEEFGSLELDVAETTASTAAQGEELQLDTGLDDELDLGSNPPGDFDLGSFDADEGAEDSEEGMVFAADGDEIATKLDLARAYMDMGDHEGARSILDEVVQEGNDSQKQEAQSLIDSID
jgi:pilus assembly protein FimV